MSTNLMGKRVAILATDGFEESELLEPKSALEGAGAETHVIAPKAGTIKAWNHDDWGTVVDVDVSLAEARAEDYDALLLPGGVMNPDKLRRDKDALEFVQAFDEQQKTIAAICHGPWTLIDAGLVAGRQLTSYHTLQTDLRNAGAEWVDKKVVVDGNLITSRQPDDLPAFIEQVIKAMARHPIDTAHG